MKRFLFKLPGIVIDLGVLSLALWLAFVMRFGWIVPFQWLKIILFLWPYIVLFEYLILIFFNIHRFARHYIGILEVKQILAATSLSTLMLLLLRFTSAALLPSFAHARYALVPIGVISINYILSFLGVTGVRVLQRIWSERMQIMTLSKRTDAPTRTLLIGAGSAGVMVVREIANRPDLNIDVVGFLDDDPNKRNTIIHGVHVLGSTDRVAEIGKRENVEQVIITIANVSGQVIRRITDQCKQAGIPTKIIPGVYEIVGGRVNLSRIRSVEIDDLLGRQPVQLDKTAIEASVRGTVIMVTGAGGSIGSEMCRQLCRFNPAFLVLVEQAENNLFHIHRELKANFPDQALAPCIVDITDVKRLESVFRKYQPKLIYHAAAHKHVPMMEWNPGEAVKNNVLGTKNTADLARRFGVERFVMISTDKAINPTSVMGVSKRVAEMYIQALSQPGGTQFITVRFGNVLGSAGSVVPIFKEQIARGGPVTVTHPDMQRFFMTIPEASQLVLQSATMGNGGEIFILDMGDPVKIVDLAKDLIRLSGFVPGEDIAIQFTGIRPGEKLFEELSVEEENTEKTRHPKIFIGKFRPNALEDVLAKIEELQQLADCDDPDKIRMKFKEIVPEYHPESLTPPGKDGHAEPENDPDGAKNPGTDKGTRDE